ncbi:sensor histidine kinase [Eubacterium multiforme]|uniref:histidine kinase n=1 Tax=Eubacterium multiforme TaxID=83339 RepID=A0ABT9UV99_9FIRM|nr:HAMP domain-containing sensor histidine kinase [Eubacterium multiforme]MDQ0150241.1 signal transduction histidine kinase [Eubacterium multiforme]
MKKNSLSYKLIITFTLILATALVVVAGVLSIWFKQYYFDQKKEQLNKESTIIESAAISYLTLDKSSNLTTLKNVMDFVSKKVDAEILITDNLGYTYAVSSSAHENYKFSSLGIPKEDMDILKKGKSIEYGSIKTSTKNDYVYLKPIFNKNYFSGVIVMVIPIERMLNPIIRVNEVIWITAIIAIIIGAVVVFLYSKKLLIDPIDKITTAARRLSKGGVEERVDIKSNNEIGELAESFNIMAASLQQVDDNRRAFISNVSHELRSPITSIKGFISGILDGVIPKDKEGYYLNIVYEETDRLSRLINDLLDISTLESGKMKLNKQEIDISNLIKHTIAKFEGAINNKELTVDVVLEQEHQYVIGDNDKITQVVTNLIDNAMKYSNENGEVKINTKSKGDKVFVSIYNDGETLSKEQLVKIWDRFYKADVSRTNKVSTGLGLPIVRLILTEHGEDIWVENYKDTGVIFTFTLTKK